MKKNLLLMLAMIMSLIGLTACQTAESEDNSQSGASGDEVTIDLWHFDPGARKEVYDDAIKRFEEKNPGVKVNALQIPNDDYKQRIMVSMSGGTPPDAFASGGGGWMEEFADSGMVKDLTDEDIDYSQFVDVAVENSTYDDKIFGLPLGISTYQFFYNKSIFEKHGLEVPNTYEELLEIIDVLKEEEIYPIALANQPQWPGAFYMMYLADRLGGEEVFQNANQRTGEGFDNEVFVEAGEYIQELVEKDAFNPGFNGVPYDEGQARQLMYSEKAAMMLMTTGFINNVRQEFPSFEEKMGVFEFPVIESGEGDPTNISAGVSPVWSVYKETKHPELTIELIKELTSVETAQDYANKAGAPVAVKGVEVEDEYLQIFTGWVNEANSIQFPYDQTLTPELAEVHKNTTYELFGGSITPQEAADAMEEKAQEVLDK